MVGPKALLILGFFATSLVWSAGLSRPDGRTHLVILGSSSGFSLIITSPQGEVATVNPDNSAGFLEKLGRTLPFYKRDLSLVVETKPNLSWTKIGEYYQIKEVWSPNSDQKPSKDIKDTQVMGLEARSWGGLTWQLFYLPDQEMVVYLSNGRSSLLLSPHGKESYWQALPDFGSVTYQVGPSASSGWTGDVLRQRFHSQTVFTNKAVSPSETKVIGEEEIVW